MHEHSTRSNFNVNYGIIVNNLFVPSANTNNYGLKQLKVNGHMIWNKLPSDLKNASSLNVFLKNLKVYYIVALDQKSLKSIFHVLRYHRFNVLNCNNFDPNRQKKKFSIEEVINFCYRGIQQVLVIGLNGHKAFLIQDDRLKAF